MLFGQAELPNVGIDLQHWLDLIVGVWFDLVSKNLGIIFIAVIIWKGTEMFEKRLIESDEREAKDSEHDRYLSVIDRGDTGEEFASSKEKRRLRKLYDAGRIDEYFEYEKKIFRREGLL